VNIQNQKQKLGSKLAHIKIFKILLQYTPTDKKTAYQTSRRDVAVKCCDDLSSLSPNSFACLPVSKCSISAVRILGVFTLFTKTFFKQNVFPFLLFQLQIEFKRENLPIACASNSQAIYISDGSFHAETITNVACVSNNDHDSIKYEVLTLDGIDILYLSSCCPSLKYSR
jgi:hypothetical protein